MVCKVIVFLALVAVSYGGIVQVSPIAAIPAKLEEYDAFPQYSFAYDVQDALTGDSKAQFETRSGDIVRGSYSLIEADGTRRIVDYTSDPINGFNAIVNREPAVGLVSLVQQPAAIVPVQGSPVPQAPSVPANGPDSDVEVIEARSGPLRQEQNQNRQPSQSGPSEQRSAAVRQPENPAELRKSNPAPLRAVASSFERQSASENDKPSATPLNNPASNIYTAAFGSPISYSLPSGYAYFRY